MNAIVRNGGWVSAVVGAIWSADESAVVFAPEFVAECDRMAQTYGPRFSPPKSLRDMAAKGKRYYAV